MTPMSDAHLVTTTVGADVAPGMSPVSVLQAPVPAPSRAG